MMPRDEAWERRAAVDHAVQLRNLLNKGQDLDVEVEGVQGTLRAVLTALRDKLAQVLAE